jgi:hypothetical protein
VLRNATTVSAEAMSAGVDLGSIEAGQLAGHVVIDGNPLVNIGDLRRVSGVMKDGQLFELETPRPLLNPLGAAIALPAARGPHGKADKASEVEESEERTAARSTRGRKDAPA